MTKETMIELLQTLPDGVLLGPTVTGLPGHFAIVDPQRGQIGHLDFFSSPNSPYVDMYDDYEDDDEHERDKRP